MGSEKPLFGFERSRARVLHGVSDSVLLKADNFAGVEHGKLWPDIVRTAGVVKTDSSGITEATEDAGPPVVRTCGFGTCYPQAMDSSFQLSNVVDKDGNDVTVTVYNQTLSEVAGDTFINVVQGIWDDVLYFYPGGEAGFKRLVRFYCTVAFTTSTSFVGGTIVEQYGPGDLQSQLFNDTTFYNVPISSGYLFEGSSGQYGLAYWREGKSYQMIQFECDTT